MQVDEKDLDAMSLSMLFVRVLMCSYIYYEMDRTSPWSDSQFDWACKKLYDNYDLWGHQNKSLLPKEDLCAGTGYAIKYTNRIISAAELWLKMAVGGA